MKKILGSMIAVVMAVGMLQIDEAIAKLTTPEPVVPVRPFDSGCGCNIPLSAKYKIQPNGFIQADFSWKQCTRKAGEKYTQWQTQAFGPPSPPGGTNPPRRNFLVKNTAARTINIDAGTHSFRVRGLCRRPSGGFFSSRPRWSLWSGIQFTTEGTPTPPPPPPPGPPSCNKTVGKIQVIDWKRGSLSVQFEIIPGLKPNGDAYNVKTWRFSIRGQHTGTVIPLIDPRTGTSASVLDIPFSTDPYTFDVPEFGGYFLSVQAKCTNGALGPKKETHFFTRSNSLFGP